MKKLLQFLCIGFIFISITNGIHAQGNAVDKAYKVNWRLVFADEFDSLGLNAQKWSNQFPWGRWTHGLHYNTNGQNFVFDGSHLAIKTDDDSLTGFVMSWDSLGNYIPYYKHFDYTSGMIYSNRNFKYGYFESKVKIPANKGLNAGFWLYGPEACEIDVFEIQGSTSNNAQMTLHWKDLDTISNSRQSIYHTYSIDSTFSQKEYTFGVKWKQNELTWYVNNNEVIEDFYTRITRSRHIPHVNMNAIFTCEVGTLDGIPDNTSLFPSYYNIDYFRAYSEDTVPPPIITGQIPISISFFSSLAIVPNMLFVSDFYHTYPAGFKVIVMSGTDYSLNGNIITPIHNDEDSIYVAVKVNDGIDDSPVFSLLVKVPDANYIQENENNKGLLVFPNPVADFLKLKLQSKNESIDCIDIFDSKGFLSIHSSMNTIEKIDVSCLAKGMYFITLTTNKGKRMLKFIKE
ncbi:MAG: family 16 glycosylhydrolase [Bacteroidota bacterium]